MTDISTNLIKPLSEPSDALVTVPGQVPDLQSAQAQAVAGAGPAFLPPFAASETGSMGIELEWMVLDRLSFDLLPAAPDILRLLEKKPKQWNATPEITTSMLEISTSILSGHASALSQLLEIRDSVAQAAFQVGAAMSGGGAHPFQRWSDQRIYPKPRYRASAQKYGYLSKLFTVFGMHVHIGMPDPDQAMRVCAWLTQHVPVFIALSGNSPYWQGEDSGFCSARSNVVGAFPMSGTLPPHVRNWHDFEHHFARLAEYGIVNSIKDFYWDVRPKPEYGTVELRVLDTPLKVEYAAALACYARELCLEFLQEHDQWPKRDCPELYTWNRFNAAKNGVDAILTDPQSGDQMPVAQIVRQDLARLHGKSKDPHFIQACEQINHLLEEGGQAGLLKRKLQAGAGLNDLARFASSLF